MCFLCALARWGVVTRDVRGCSFAHPVGLEPVTVLALLVHAYALAQAGSRPAGGVFGLKFFCHTFFASPLCFTMSREHFLRLDKVCFISHGLSAVHCLSVAFRQARVPRGTVQRQLHHDFLAARRVPLVLALFYALALAWFVGAPSEGWEVRCRTPARTRAKEEARVREQGPLGAKSAKF